MKVLPRKPKPSYIEETRLLASYVEPFKHKLLYDDAAFAASIIGIKCGKK